MPRIRLVIEYDGTDYAGWQRQENGPSVQQQLEEALAVLLKQPVVLHGAGRTDAGVHARGMVAHFDAALDLPMKAYVAGLNTLLPPAIAVRTAVPAADDFHARFMARGKWYRYTIYRGPVRSPLEARSSWHVRKPLNVDAMRQAAQDFVGSYDYAAFRSGQCEATVTRREVSSVLVHEQGELIQVDVRGRSFLRNMVRMMVGTLVEIGFGRRPQDAIPAMLRSATHEQHRLCAPPQGLCLMQVLYGPAEAPEKPEEQAGNRG